MGAASADPAEFITRSGICPGDQDFEEVVLVWMWGERGFIALFMAGMPARWGALYGSALHRSALHALHSTAPVRQGRAGQG